MSQLIIRKNSSQTLIQKAETCIVTVDVVKSYSKSQMSLKIAVTTMDMNGLPIIGTDVSLVIVSPNGTKQIRNESADHHGIALFVFYCSEEGFWDIIVSKVTHPFFKVRLTRDSHRLLMLKL